MVAEITGSKKIGLEYKTFPDGESYLRVSDPALVGGETVVLVHTTYPQQDKRVTELLLLIDLLRELGARKIIAAVPYMAYARQDTRFRDGEAVSIRTLFRLIESAGADEFLTVDLHKEASLGAFRIKARNIHATDAIADYLKGAGLSDPYILSPDKGAIELAKRVGDRLNAEYGNFEKTRDRITGAITMRGERVDARGRDAVIIDDMISTGGTIAKAAAILKGEGARRVMAVCTHPLLVAGAAERMRASGVDEVLGTDTVESGISRIPVAPLIAKELG